MAWSRDFQKCIIYPFLDKFFFANIFTIYKLDFERNFNFCKFANFFANSKSRAQGLFNYVSFVIFGHQTWDLEGGGGQIFKYPSRERVKNLEYSDRNIELSKTFCSKS